MRINETTMNLGLQIALSAINTIGYAMKTRALSKQQELCGQRGRSCVDAVIGEDSRPRVEERVVYRTVVKEIPASVSQRVPDMVPVGRLDVMEQIARLRDLQSHVYRRLEEYRTETDEAERLLLCIEMAAGIRRALDAGTRCILDQRMKRPYMEASLARRIDMCLPFLGGDAIDSLHRARELCNPFLHAEDVANAAARFAAAAKTPGLLIRFIETIADEHGTDE